MTTDDRGEGAPGSWPPASAAERKLAPHRDAAGGDERSVEERQGQELCASQVDWSLSGRVIYVPEVRKNLEIMLLPILSD